MGYQHRLANVILQSHTYYSYMQFNSSGQAEYLQFNISFQVELFWKLLQGQKISQYNIPDKQKHSLNRWLKCITHVELWSYWTNHDLKVSCIQIKWIFTHKYLMLQASYFQFEDYKGQMFCLKLCLEWTCENALALAFKLKTKTPLLIPYDIFTVFHSRLARE